MEKFYGNYLGLCINNADPDQRGRVQIFIPHIMPALYERWNQAGVDRKIEIIGNNLEDALPQEDVEQLKKMLPWAEAASPIFGNSVAGHYNPQSGNFNQSYGTENEALAGPNPSAINSGAISLNANGTVNKGEFLGFLESEVARSGLNGFVPSDGARFGIDGSPRSWANYFFHLANKESSFNTNTVGDIGRFAGNSNGLFQLSPNDAVNYGLNGGRPFSQQQLTDPVTNTQAAIAITSRLVRQDGAIGSDSRTGAARYWGPLRRGWTPPASSFSLNDPSAGILPGSSNPAQPSPFLDPQPKTYTSITPDQQAVLDAAANTVASQGQLPGTLPGSGVSTGGVGGGGGGPVVINRVPPSGTGQGQLTTGTITLNLPNGESRTYNFNNGGWKYGAIPAGSYTISGGERTPQSGMVVDGSGWKFILSDKYDPGRGGTRTGLRIHPDGGAVGTQGCLGIVGNGATQEQFYADMKAVLAANGGSITTDIVDNLPGTGQPGATSGGTPAPSIPAGMHQTTTSTQPTVTDTTGMPQGLFSVPNPGAMLWVFFREGDPLFPVYFAASYGAREWNNAYKGASPKAHYPNEGDTTPRNQAIFRPNQAGGLTFTDTITDEEDTRSIRMFHANGAHLEMHLNGSTFYSPNEHIQQVAGNHFNSCLNRESWTQGTSNSVTIGDRITIVGNMSEEAVAAIEEHAKIVKDINKNMLKGGGSTA